jgi:hypothetical protein
MEVPRSDPLLGRVSDDDIMILLQSLRRGAGVRQLARTLGFTAAMRPRGMPRSWSGSVRSVFTARRDTLRIHVVRTLQPVTTHIARTMLDAWLSEDPASHHLLVLLEPHARRITFACDIVGDGIRHASIVPAAVRPVDCDIVRDLVRSAPESGTAAAMMLMRALDRRTLTARFFRDVRALRDLVSRSWICRPAASTADRDALALLLISRLVFLYFLQHRGLLAGNDRFLPGLLAHWQRRRTAGSFYRTVLRTLFFGVLNRRPERRTQRARALGCLPYLNGGLFEQHRIERRCILDLPDDVIVHLFAALLEKYRFTAADTAVQPGAGVGDGIDPELLGRIFEGLMPGDRRAATGSFYTPAPAVDRLIAECLTRHFAHRCALPHEAVARLLAAEPHDLDATELRRIAETAASTRILDPACGSGAFLLGALARLERLRGPLPTAAATCDQLRRDIVARSLHGVDLLEDAALICSLRLWLALVPHCTDVRDVPPLPNLDRRVRQGDALVDPLDATAASAPSHRATRMVLRQLATASAEYLDAEPDTRSALRRRIAHLEAVLARVWLDSVTHKLRHAAADLHARSDDRDLFGEISDGARAARRRLPALTRRLDGTALLQRHVLEARSLPFFSFSIHFADAPDGFDVVLCNPPWVRAHAWPAATAALLRDSYRVCENAGWPRAAQLTRSPAAAGTQVDLAMLFLERSIRLLRNDGTLAMVLPAKLLRSLAPGGARALLLNEAPVTSIEDHSLEQRAVFDADAFTTMITATRAPQPPPLVRVRLARQGNDLDFDVPRDQLPLVSGDVRAPWLLAPPETALALRAMQARGSYLGHQLHVRRGAMTGANDALVVDAAEPRLGDLASISVCGSTTKRSAIVEASVVRPLLRGTDVHAWNAMPSRFVLWSPLNDNPVAPVPRRFAAFLRRRPRHGYASHDGRLHRISDGILGHKVVWSDLARDLRAAAVTDTIRSCGAQRPVVPLNTVYFIPVPDHDTALLLTAYMNSLPLRTFARAIAERAKDAHFRFFAWTIAVLPLPLDWRTNVHAAPLADIARAAHVDRHLAPAARSELDARVAQAFHLSAAHIDALASFDAWLSGDSR